MKKNKKTPLIDNPLRLPGQSIDTEIQRVIDDEASQYILIPIMALVMAAIEWWRWYTNSAFAPKIFTLVAIIAVIFSGYKIIKIKKKLKNLRLGKEGEIAVGQYLELFREKGFKVFHDVIGKNGEEYNIDHVLIGSKGIFTIETKTYSKPVKGKANVVFDGHKIFLNGKESQSDIVSQAKAESNWLTNKLKTLTGKTYKVKPVVVFPGWYTENIAKGKSNLWVLNPKGLVAFLSNTPDVFSREEVQCIANNLSRYIRETNKKP